VLSLGKIKLSGESYYLNAVADGIDEYYRGVGEAPGRWAGTAVEAFGLDGEVAADELHSVWAGLDPATGERLGRFAGREIAGWDLTFRAPKSVSLLAALGDLDTAAVVKDAHDAAVDAAFGYIERSAARSRTGKNGVNQIDVNGLVAAGFRHRTSRAGDPHLHTHMLVANMAECVDGKWRTLDGRLLLLHAKTAGCLYEAHLRYELTRRLGVEWGPVHEGIADVVGIDQEVLNHFSDRRKEIDEHLDEVGFRSARAAQLATLETRKAKDLSADGGSIRGVWDAKAAKIGFDPVSLTDAVDRVSRAAPVTNRDVLFDGLLTGTGLTERASSFDRRDVLRAIVDRLPAGATVADIEDMADELIRHPEVVRLVETDRPGLLSSNVIRRSDGTIVAAGINEARWSTAELIGIERHVVGRALARTGEGTGVVDGSALAEVMARRPTLTVEQADMVAQLTRSGNGIDVVCAAAGTGKTYTLDAAREAWQTTGHHVIGAALAGIAAQELQSTAGIASSTLAMLQIDLAAGRIRFDDRTVVVIDEAGMAGTRNLAPILDAADQAGAKVVLVGDPHQLPEIDAGGVLTGLAQRLDPIELTENRRQRTQWERQALAELRAGDIETAFASYQDNGRVVTATTAIEVRQVIVADWWSYRLAGDTTAMLAFRRSDVDDLNGRARAYLARAGELSGPELVVDERPYQTGDQIICLKNNRRLGVCNGTRATITTVDPDSHTLTIDTGDRRVVLPATYLDAGQITHGYATTIHKTQGATVDRGLLLGTDELFRERGYVGMSRGRISNHLYLVGAAELDDSTSHGPPPPGSDPIEAVQQALHHRSDQRLAIDTGEPLAFWDIADLVTERHRLRRLLAACPPDRTPDIAALTARRQQVAGDIEPLVYRHNELADRKLRGPATRTEMRNLRHTISERSAGLDRIATELNAARSAMSEREKFQTDHAHDTGLLDAVEYELDRHINHRVAQQMADPSDYHLRILGPVPTNPDAQAAWKRGATILETHYLGADTDPTIPPRPTLLGHTAVAEMRAQLEIMAIPTQPELPSLAIERNLERDLGRDLFD
jgi:conjugative relaxase-like TrwC/TraI family protein